MFATLGIDYARQRHLNDICCAERRAHIKSSLGTSLRGVTRRRRLEGDAEMRPATAGECC
jgi:hypothetical protein